MSEQEMTPARPSFSSSLSGLIRIREAGIALFLLILVIVVALQTPTFLKLNNIEDLFQNISILAIVALGQMMVILTHGIDLSVSSVIALVAMMVAFIMKQAPGLPIPLAILLGMTLGAMLGTINAVVITYGKVPPIIATLGTLSIYRGLVFFYSQGAWVNAFELPTSFKTMANSHPLGLPNLIIFAIVVSILVFYFLNYTRTGRDIYAVGSNSEAAGFVGIRRQRILLLVYVLSGLLAGLAGVLWASYYASAQTNTALGFELQTVAACVVGGVSISGGVGTVPGVLLGALLLGTIQNALHLVNISPFWELAAQGLLILLAVVSDNLIQRSTRRTADI
jgi:rhamnose transport system permease protein